ncbi:hypothetical protein ACQP2T_45245 [Nonomuraea sp. CA-143628]|uniref:hypothetical protein n=1 Tax=Nonomuraea sp. CA-143628 TaxID=3239997 RepID=UPI003D8EF049
MDVEVQAEPRAPLVRAPEHRLPGGAAERHSILTQPPPQQTARSGLVAGPPQPTPLRDGELRVRPRLAARRQRQRGAASGAYVHPLPAVDGRTRGVLARDQFVPLDLHVLVQGTQHAARHVHRAGSPPLGDRRRQTQVAGQPALRHRRQFGHQEAGRFPKPHPRTNQQISEHGVALTVSAAPCQVRCATGQLATQADVPPQQMVLVGQEPHFGRVLVDLALGVVLHGVTDNARSLVHQQALTSLPTAAIRKLRQNG